MARFNRSLVRVLTVMQRARGGRKFLTLSAFKTQQYSVAPVAKGIVSRSRACGDEALEGLQDLLNLEWIYRLREVSIKPGVASQGYIALVSPTGYRDEAWFWRILFRP